MRNLLCREASRIRPPSRAGDLVEQFLQGEHGPDRNNRLTLDATRADDGVDHPRRQRAVCAVRELAENVLAPTKLHAPPRAQLASSKGMPPVANGDADRKVGRM
jgi:hypothetical protein